MKFFKKPLLNDCSLYGDVCRNTTACRRASTSEPECARKNQLVASRGKHLKPLLGNQSTAYTKRLCRDAHRAAN